MATLTYRSATCNVYTPGSAANTAKTIRAAMAAAHVVKFQEAHETATLNEIRRAKNFDAWIPNGTAKANPIAWRSDLFDRVAVGWYKIYDNKANVKDGPDRTMTWVLLRHKKTRVMFIEVNVHMIHQAFTSHKERRPGWNSSLAVVGQKTAFLLDHYKGYGAPVAVSGDWNRPDKGWNLPGVLDHEVASSATFGSRRYDRYFIAGPGIKAKQYRVINTPSDHHVLVVEVTIVQNVSGSTPKPEPKPEPAKEAPVAKNNVTEAREEFAQMFAHWRKGNELLRKAPRSRTVVKAVERTMTAAYHVAARAFKTLPKS